MTRAPFTCDTMRPAFSTLTCQTPLLQIVPSTTTTTVPKCILPPLDLGPNLSIPLPVILAPMAGVTNYPFRKLCRTYGAALYVSEMVHAATVQSGHTNARVRFGPDEALRSAQLYATDPTVAANAAQILIERDAVHHIDLNFGCPAPKVLRRGGGAAIPANEHLLRDITTAVVNVARGYQVPVTAKMRAGINDTHMTYARAGQVLQECGVAAVTLHARTAEERYDSGRGRAGWMRIRHLSQLIDVPVIGNGDVFTAKDALDMVRKTGAAGVAIGRGCLGRPWLFRDLHQAFEHGLAEDVFVPAFEEVRDVMTRHVAEVVVWAQGDGVSEEMAIRSMRKWFGWYWRGYSGLPGDWVKRMCAVCSLQELEEVVGAVDGKDVGFVLGEIVAERGKVGRSGNDKR